MATRIAAAVLLTAGLVVYFARQTTNPPGFYIDECSIAFNALQIARHGVDEYGISCPLFFKAFGEYKNPAYIYLLAGLFKVMPPSNLAARRLSAAFGYLACVAIGWLGWRISRSRFVAAAAFLMAVFTPMIFEISRLTFEVALYPLATALFLAATWRASRRGRWTVLDVVAITAALLLLLYTYSIGRLFAPLMLASLFILCTRARLPHLIAIAVAFTLLGIVPIIVYNRTHDGALTLRFRGLTYLDAAKPLESLVTFEPHYVENLLPLGMALEGDPNSRHHVPHSGGSILLATFVLAAAGAVLAARSRDRWWLFVLAGTALSLLPVSLTFNRYHSLRMAPYPVFLLVLSIPALQWLQQRRAAAAAIMVVGAIQACWFMAVFHRDGPNRFGEFDHGARRAVNTAIDQGVRPIYVDDNVYMQTWWYGAQRGLEPSAFIRAAPSKPGSVVISGSGVPPNATLLLGSEGYAVYVTR